MKKRALHSALLFCLIFIHINCNDNVITPEKKPKFTAEIRGKVILQNQPEYSNTLVFIDKINRGVSTDSSGNYTIIVTEEDCDFNDELKLIYFLNDYEMDTVTVVLVDGKIKHDSLDVAFDGTITTKELNQIVLVEGWTDKSQYSVGDSVDFTTRITNLSNRVIHIFIGSCGGVLSNFIFLYNDKYTSFQLGGEHDVLTLDCDIYLQPNEFYEGRISYQIIEYKPLIADKYIVTTNFFIESRLLNQFESNFNRYVIEDWYKIHRGTSPKLDWFPNKYKFPLVQIIP